MWDPKRLSEKSNPPSRTIPSKRPGELSERVADGQSICRGCIRQIFTGEPTIDFHPTGQSRSEIWHRDFWHRDNADDAGPMPWPLPPDWLAK